MDYNKIIADGLTELQKNEAEKSGAKKFLGVLKFAASAAAMAGVPVAGPAAVLIKLADAGISGLDGNASAIDLDKLFVTSATADLKAKGITEDDIKRIEGAI